MTLKGLIALLYRLGLAGQARRREAEGFHRELIRAPKLS